MCSLNLAADLNLNIKGYFEQNRLLKRAKTKMELALNLAYLQSLCVLQSCV